MAKLRPSNIDASAGAADEVARLVAHIRTRWPRTRILLRADSGFARDALMAWCEANRVDFLFGLARNSRLSAEIEAEMAEARAESQVTAAPARRFRDFTWSTRNSWGRTRRVVGKAEWLPGQNRDKANPRFVVTSLPPGEAEARHLYEAVYCARGEMENRIKECQLDLFADRTSIATMQANQLRLWLASAAYVRHDPAEAAESRRPGAGQRAPGQGRHGVSLPGPAGMGDGLRRPATSRRLTPRTRHRTDAMTSKTTVLHRGGSAVPTIPHQDPARHASINHLARSAVHKRPAWRL